MDFKEASAKDIAETGFDPVKQKVHPGFAPFLLSEGVAPDLARVIPAPHFAESKVTA